MFANLKLCESRLYQRKQSREEEMMELYLFVALFLIYLLTSFMSDKAVMQKIWLAAFLLCFVITAIAVSFLRLTSQEVMMNATELSWYYILYLFASLMVVLGLINIWMFRKPIFRILLTKTTKDEDNDD